MRIAVRFVIAAALVLLSAPGWAQLAYFTLFDADNNAATGCTVTLSGSGAVAGIERRLTATVSETATPQVTQLSLESCVGSRFDAPVPLPGAPYPVGIDNGLNGADVIEQAVAISAIAEPGATVRLYFATQSTTGDDLLAAVDGAGGEILLVLASAGGGEPVPIPTLTTWGLLGLALLLAGLASWRLRWTGQPLSALLLIVLTGLALAVTLDGDVGDWTGKSPVATDPGGDSANPATDLVAAFAAQENGNLFIRLDVSDLNNGAPVVAPVTFGIAENSATGAVVGTVTATDPNPGQTLSYAITGGNTGGAFAINAATGAITVANSAALDFETTPGFNLTVQATDDGAPPQTGSGAITVNLTDIDEPPVANAQSVTTPEDTPLAIILTGSDPENQTLSFTPGAPTQGVLSGTAPNLTYTPNANVSGADSFTFTVSDGANTSAPATVSITITAVNDPPVATNDAATLTEDDPATAIDVLVNDTDADGGPIGIAAVTQPANGAVVITGGGTGLTYQPNADYCNTPPGAALDAFTYTLDGGSTATVSVTVTCVNDAPALDLNGPAAPGIDFAATFTEGDPPLALVDAVDLTVSDIDNGNLVSATVTLANLVDAGDEVLAVNPNTVSPNTAIVAAYDITTPGLGVLTLTGAAAVAEYQTALRSVTYTNNSANPDTTARAVTFVVNDGAADSAVATSTVTVVSVNSPPVVDAANFSIAENSADGANVGSPITFTDPDTGQTHTFAITGGNTGDAFAINANTGQITVASGAALDFEATPTFSLTVQVTDDGTPAQAGSATVTINLTDVNEAPAPGGGPFSIAENSANGTVVGAVAANDPDSGQTHTFAITGGNVGGAFAINVASGQITVANSAALDFETTPTFSLTVQVTDDGAPAQSGTGTITIDLNNVNEPPVANPQSVTTLEDTLVTITLTGADPENGSLTFSIGTPPTNGSLSGAGASRTYTPNPNTSGSDSFTFTVSDGTNTSAPATVGITITAVNDPPTITGQNAISTLEDTSRTIAFADLLVTDPDNAYSTGFTLTVGDGANYTRAGNTITPALNFNGTLTVPVGVNDGAADSNTFNLTVTVTPVNDPPTVAVPPGPFAVTGNVRRTLTAGALLAGASDPDGATALTTQRVGTPSDNAGVTVNADGSFSYNPGPGFEGNASFQYQVCDDGIPPPGQCSANVTVTVTVSGMIWFIDNSRATNGDGRLGSPFNTIANFNSGAADDPGDNIFLYRQTAANYTGPLTLLNNQKLIGQGATASLSAITGLTPPPGSDNLPATGGGVRPLIAHNANNLTLGQGNTLRGFDLSNTGGTALIGNAFGNLSVLDMSVANAGGTAVNLDNGNPTATFTSVSSSNAANGIVLASTTGSFTVTGTGTAGTGGTIQGMSGDGISLTNAQNVSLSFMNVRNNLGSGIFGDDVTNFSLTGGLVDNSADVADGTEAGLRFNELLGACAITNSTISNSRGDNIRLTPASGTLTNLTVSGSTIGPAANGNGFAVVSSGAAATTVTITGTTFTNNFASGYLTTIGDNGTHTVTISGSAFRDNNIAIDIGNGPNADVRATLQNNTEIVRHASNAFNLITDGNSTNAAQYTLTASGNVVGNGTADSGSRDARGIALDMRGDADAVTTISNNTISNTDIEGIFAQSRLDNDADAQIGLFDLNLTNNVINTPDDNSAFPFGAVFGVLLESRNTTNACMNIAGNDSASIGAFEHFRVRQRDTATFRLERLSDGDAIPNELLNDTALVESFVVGQNVGGSTADALLDTGFTEAANGICRDP